jgi:predicted PurR-regulated permease PerM
MNDLKLPFMVKAGFAFICGFSIIFLLCIGKSILIPVVYSSIIAILLNPLVKLLTRFKINKIAAIFISVIFSLIIVACIIYLISTQISIFVDTYPKLREKLSMRGSQLISWISDNFNIKTDKINAWVNTNQDGMVNNLGSNIGSTLGTISNIILVSVLIPVYISMILFYKPLLSEFIKQLFHIEHHEKVFDIITKSKKIIQSYLIGLLFELIIIATLNSIGLICLGIDYAIILGIIGALLNVIPLIGGVLAIIPPMIIAFVTKESVSYSLFVIIVYIIIQFIDNHYIIPHIVASKVKINALVSIIVVFIGGELWGIPGMFLSIPVTAIIKVIFDNIESLKPWGFLLGNVVPIKPKRLPFIPKRKVK